MKKVLLVIAIVLIVVAVVLFTPTHFESLDDGGTSAYSSLTYKIVNWKKLLPVNVLEEETEEILKMQEVNGKKCIYWFPDNYKSLDELWQMEMEKWDDKKTIFGTTVLFVNEVVDRVENEERFRVKSEKDRTCTLEEEKWLISNTKNKQTKKYIKC